MTDHAFDATESLVGKGMVGVQREQDAPDIDTLLVAVGGGGLIGGVAAWYGGRIKNIRVEPEAPPALSRAPRARPPLDSPAGGNASGSLAAKPLAHVMLSHAQKYRCPLALPARR